MIAPASDRLPTLDILRGFAVLGSLAAVSFLFIQPYHALVPTAGLAETPLGGHFAWLANFMLIEDKMRGVFCIIFGAAMLLAMDKAEMSGGNGYTAQIKRCLWLCGIALASLVLRLSGEVLILYALAGLAALHLTSKSALALAKLAFLCFGIQLLVDIAAVIIAHYDNISLIAHLAEMLAIFEMIGFMLLGMAMLKGAFITGRWSALQYMQTARHSLTVGFSLLAPLGAWVVWSGYAPLTVLGTQLAWALPMRIAVSVGYVALMLFLIAKMPEKAIWRHLGNVGRMSLSNMAMAMMLIGIAANYTSSAIPDTIAPIVFLAMTLGLSLIILAVSALWLRYFRYGPIEWVWRSLERARPLPFRV